MKGTIHSTTTKKKKKCVMNYFPKLMISEHSFSWKSKSPPLSNEFLLDAIQTFQGYQFIFYRKKKLLPVFKRYAWEIEEQEVEEAKVPGWGDWAFPEHLKGLFSCQGRNQLRVGFNLRKWRSQRKNKKEDLVIFFHFHLLQTHGPVA